MTEKDPHVILGEWLLNMGYPKDKFPSEDQLKKVCRGSIFRSFWKDVVKNVKPKLEVALIKENVFVKAIQRYELIENSSKAKLRQVLPPEPLLLWKTINENKAVVSKLRKDSEISDTCLSEKLVKLKMKCSHVDQLKMDVEEVQREIHLVKETIRQVNEDIHQSKTLANITTSIPCLKKNVALKMKHDDEIDVLADFLQSTNVKQAPEESSAVEADKVELPHNSTSGKTIHNYESLFSTNLDEVETVDVEKVLENVDLSELYANLMRRREANISYILEDKKIEEELDEVEDNARSKNVLQWKESLAQINLMHANVTIAALQHKNNAKNLASEFVEVLKSKDASAKIPPRLLESLKLKCKFAQLSAFIECFKEFSLNLSTASGMFSGNIKENNGQANYGQAIINLRDDILALHSFHHSKQILVNSNIFKLSESINIMKEIRKSVFNCLGHGDFCFVDRNESLNMSVFQANSTMKTVVGRNLSNLIDAKYVFCETNANRQTKQDIRDVSNLFLSEVKSLKRFHLGKNRKIVLDTGEKIWIDDTIRNATLIDTEAQHNLFRVLNPMKTIPEMITIFERMFLWKKSLQTLSQSIDLTDFRNLPTKDDLAVPVDELKDPKVDNVLKNAKKCLRPLHVVDEIINELCKTVKFFKKFEAKKYISENRLLDGRNYTETEHDVKLILAEDSYWK